MKKMLVLAMTMAMVLLAAAGVCETLRVGMECNYAPYNWTQSDASENAVAIAAGIGVYLQRQRTDGELKVGCKTCPANCKNSSGCCH